MPETKEDADIQLESGDLQILKTGLEALAEKQGGVLDYTLRCVFKGAVMAGMQAEKNGLTSTHAMDYLEKVVEGVEGWMGRGSEEQ